MLKRTEKYLEKKAANRAVTNPTTNPFTQAVTEYEFITPEGFTLTPGTRFRVKGETGQLFNFLGITTNRNGDQWIAAFGGDKPKSEHRHYRGYRAFSLDRTFIEPKKADR